MTPFDHADLAAYLDKHLRPRRFWRTRCGIKTTRKSEGIR